MREYDYMDRSAVFIRVPGTFVVLGCLYEGKTKDLRKGANELLASVKHPQLSLEDYEKAVDALIETGMVTRRGRTLKLTAEGVEALRVSLYGSDAFKDAAVNESAHQPARTG